MSAEFVVLKKSDLVKCKKCPAQARICQLTRWTADATQGISYAYYCVAHSPVGVK